MMGLLLQHPAAAAIDQHRLPTGLTQRLAVGQMDGQTAGHYCYTDPAATLCILYEQCQ